MPKYLVQIQEITNYTLLVEAKDEEEAEDLGYYGHGRTLELHEPHVEVLDVEEA